MTTPTHRRPVVQLFDDQGTPFGPTLPVHSPLQCTIELTLDESRTLAGYFIYDPITDDVYACGIDRPLYLGVGHQFVEIDTRPEAAAVAHNLAVNAVEFGREAREISPASGDSTT